MAWGRGEERHRKASGASGGLRGSPGGDGHFVWRGCPGKADSGGVWGKRQGQDGVAATLEVK